MNIDLTNLRDLERLQKALSELGAPDPDQGARLHAEKNSPAVSGMYAELKFPPYQFRPYPKMLYSADYLDACAEYDRALRIVSRGDDQTRDLAIKQAQYRKDQATRTVESEEQEEALAGAGWADTPQRAKEKKEALERAVAQAAAEAAYADRNMGELARREREAIDADHEGHLVEVPETPKGPRGTRVKVG